MSSIGEKFGQWFGRGQNKDAHEGESFELRMINERLAPFHVEDKVRIIPFGAETLDLDEGWVITGYSKQYEEATLHKEVNGGDANSPGYQPKYIYDRASIKQLLEWNPEFQVE